MFILNNLLLLIGIKIYIKSYNQSWRLLKKLLAEQTVPLFFAPFFIGFENYDLFYTAQHLGSFSLPYYIFHVLPVCILYSQVLFLLINLLYTCTSVVTITKFAHSPIETENSDAPYVAPHEIPHEVGRGQNMDQVHAPPVMDQVHRRTLFYFYRKVLDWVHGHFFLK